MAHGVISAVDLVGWLKVILLSHTAFTLYVGGVDVMRYVARGVFQNKCFVCSSAELVNDLGVNHDSCVCLLL